MSNTTAHAPGEPRFYRDAVDGPGSASTTVTICSICGEQWDYDEWYEADPIEHGKSCWPCDLTNSKGDDCTLLIFHAGPCENDGER